MLSRLLVEEAPLTPLLPSAAATGGRQACAQCPGYGRRTPAALRRSPRRGGHRADPPSAAARAQRSDRCWRRRTLSSQASMARRSTCGGSELVCVYTMSMSMSMSMRMTCTGTGTGTGTRHAHAMHTPCTLATHTPRRLTCGARRRARLLRLLQRGDHPLSARQQRIRREVAAPRAAPHALHQLELVAAQLHG